MQLNELHIQNFRCFSDYHITFAPRLTVLFGKNGTGRLRWYMPSTRHSALHLNATKKKKHSIWVQVFQIWSHVIIVRLKIWQETQRPGCHFLLSTYMRVPHSKVFPLIGTCMPPPLRCSQVSLEKHTCVWRIASKKLTSYLCLPISLMAFLM